MDGEISAAEHHDCLDDGPVRVVDVRRPGAFREAHIPGSENLPMTRLPDRIEELRGAEHVVTVCPHGKASVQAARLVASYEGVSGRVESLAGGIEGWPYGFESAEPGDEGPEAPF